MGTVALTVAEERPFLKTEYKKDGEQRLDDQELSVFKISWILVSLWGFSHPTDGRGISWYLWESTSIFLFLCQSLLPFSPSSSSVSSSLARSPFLDYSSPSGQSMHSASLIFPQCQHRPSTPSRASTTVWWLVS